MHLANAGSSYHSPYGNNPVAGQSEGEKNFLAGLQQFLPQLASSLGQVGNTSSYFDKISELLRPSMVTRPFQQGSAALREQANLTGTLSSTGTQSSLTDLFSGLERNLGQATVPAALGAEQNTINAASTAFNMAGLPRTIEDLGIQRGMQQSQFGASLPIQALGAAGGLSGGYPGYQPHFGPDRYAQMAGTFGNILGQSSGGKGASAAAPAAGAAVGTASGGK